MRLTGDMSMLIPLSNLSVQTKPLITRAFRATGRPPLVRISTVEAECGFRPQYGRSRWVSCSIQLPVSHTVLLSSRVANGTEAPVFTPSVQSSYGSCLHWMTSSQGQKEKRYGLWLWTSALSSVFESILSIRFFCV